MLAFSLDIENMNCDIHAVRRGRRRRGRALLEGLLAAMPHRARLQRAQRLRPTRASPSSPKEYADPASVDYSQVEVPNARWHETHTFTCFAYPTFTEDDMQQIGAALVKVIKAYS